MSDRKISTDALETLGKVIDETQKRDAIHLAVEPVIAGEDLFAGVDIGISEFDGMAYETVEPHLGIVDPFVGDVKKGQRFWLVIYPRQITSLRHVWSHPLIKDVPEVTEVKNENKAISEEWIKNFLDSNDSHPTFHALLTAALEHEHDGWGDFEYLTIRDENAYGDIPDELWDHLEVVLGKKFPKDKRATHFSCAC